MSGDLGAEVVVRAAAASLDKHSDLQLALVGDEAQLRDLVTRIIGDERRLSVRPASEVVAMTVWMADLETTF